MGLVRKNITQVQPYVAGKPIEETKRQFGLREVVKLASNENPLGPSPKAVAAVRKAAAGVHRYPDSGSVMLKRKLAKHLGVVPGSIVLGNGSDELIDVIIRTFVEDDENVLTADVTFLEYEIISRVLGREIKRVPLRYFKYDLPALRSAIDRKTKVVFIANPNNPTGTYVTKAELEWFIAGLPAHVILVLDEAYDLFIDVADFASGIPYAARNNVITLKTFSKAYGLAGLRCGYAIAPLRLAEYMERTRQPFNVNALAQCAALAALDDGKFLQKTRALVLRGKAYVCGQLRAMGLGYVPSVANFILINVGRSGVDVFKAMLKHGVIVRDMQQYGLKNYIRVTVGTKRENEKFIAALKKVL